MKKKMFLIILTLVFSVLTATAMFSSTAGAKSLYVISDINSTPTPVEAYNIWPNGTLDWQATDTVPYFGWGGVGLGVDTDSAILFVTYEMSNTIQLVNATTMADEGTTTAPSATNLAGIVCDQEKQKVYTIDRNTNHLYVYSWDPITKTLTLDGTTYITLSEVYSAYGIALDEGNDLLYVADYTNAVKIVNTADWSSAGSITVSNLYTTGIAIDASHGFVYTGSINYQYVSPYYYSYLSRYDLNTDTEIKINIGNISGMTDYESIMGVATDSNTQRVYITTGYYDDKLLTFDSNLNLLQTINMSGDPTGLCVPGKDISYNPLSITKDDGLGAGECVSSGGNINYNICFDNGNEYDVNNVELFDVLPSEVDFVSASDGGVYDSGTHSVTWDLGTIPAESAEQCISLVVQVKSGTEPETEIMNYLTIDSDETPPTTVSEETLVCEESGEDYPPTQTVELGTPLMEDIYYTGLEWLDLIGSQTPVWINSSDAETGTDFIKYKLFKSDVFGNWNDPDWVYVYDNQQTGDPFTTDADLNDGRISIQFYIEESCFHQIHAHCVDTVGNWNYSAPYDFLVDFDAPSNDDFTYIDSYLLPGGARYINNQTIKRIFANDTGCTGGVAGVDRIIWRIENDKTQIIAEGIIYDNDDTGYEDANVSVSGDLDDTEGKMIIDIQLKEECMHFIYHQAIDKLENKVFGRKQLVYVDLTPPTIVKTVGDPNCTIVPGEEYCVTMETPIHINAEDRGCMGGVGLDFLTYRIWNESDGWGDWFYIEDSEGETIYFDEECTHYLEIYAVDLLGNDVLDNETFYVDETYPVINKLVGYPNCVIEEIEVYCVTTDTNITINASDPGCCDSLTVEYRVWNDSFDSGWITIGILPFNYSFTEQCFHNLSIRAYDCLGHIVYDNESFYVDDTPPIIEKIVGDPKCVIIDGEEYCITPQTPITINAYNDGCCVDTYLYVEYQINDGNWTPVIDLPTDIYIGEECNHTLTIRAYDCLGNMAEDVELFHVDNTSPIIEKTVGDPNCTLNCKSLKLPSSSVTMVVQHWGANSYFDVTLSDVPFGYDIANGDYLGWCVDENNSISSGVEYSVDLWCSYDPLMPWPDDDWDMVNYIINHKHPDATKTDIQEAIWYFVDGGDDPSTDIGQSMVENATNFGEGFMPSIGEWCAILCDAGEGIQKTFIEVLVPDRYCVTTDTLITLDAVDLGCCPSLITIEYRIWNITDGWSDWIKYTGEFSFEEECEHYLEVRAYDCLENGIDIIDNETFYVDDTPPEIIKTVGDPNCTGCGEMGDDDYCVTTDTLITLEAVEQGCCPSEGVTIEYKIGDGDWIEYIEPFNFTEECEHILLVRAYDCLGNGLDCGCWDIETFYVDDTPPPKPEKIVGDPKVKLEDDSSGHDQWMIFPETEINFTGYGDEGCCPCEEVTIEYRIWYMGTWTDWTIYTGNITLSGGCVHYLEARAYDCLGNRGEIDNETFWVCSPGGDFGPEIRIIEPTFGSTHCERTLEVKIEASDDETPSSELELQLWIPGGYKNSPTLWYEPVYNESDGYFYAYIDIFKYQDGAGITLEAVAIDEDYNYERALPVTFTVCSTTVWDQWMQNGWNSLTIPFGGISCNNSVESVLASIDGMYSKVYYYDILEDKWHSWIEELVAEGFVDLENMYSGKEYWVKMNGTQARFYTDTHAPEVEILDPINGEIRSEGPGNINLYAYDIETGIADVHVLILDWDGSYWNGSVWQEDPVWLLCDYDYGDYWSYTSEGIWTIGHTYNISAIATDGAGCTAVDGLSFSIECTECPTGSGATVIPDYVEVTLVPGESIWDNKTIITDEIPIGKLDVMFLFDLTGSMGGVISSAKASAIDIMNDIRSNISDSAFGVGSFMDYPDFDPDGYCGYYSTYGSSSGGDYPWNLDQDVTLDTTVVSTSINGLSLGYGADGPEAYARALYESQFTGWRTGARKIVIIFEDNIPHDCDFSTFGCSGDTGVDPGRDATAGTSDDLPWVDVIADLKAADISVIVVDSGGYDDCPWEYAADETGGIFSELGSTSTLPAEIVALVEDITSTVSELTLEPGEEFEDWFDWEPTSHYDVGGGETVEFNVTVTVPERTLSGMYHICLMVMGDGSILAVQELWITVEEELPVELYNISGTIYCDEEVEIGAGDTLSISVFDHWPSSGPEDSITHQNITDPTMPLDYTFQVPNGSYYVVAVLCNISGEVPYACGAAVNVTPEDFELYGPDEIIVAGADVPDQDVTLYLIEEEPEYYPPYVNITYPADGTVFNYSEEPGLTITGEAYDVDTYVDRVLVSLYYNDGNLYYFNGSSYAWETESYYFEATGTGAGTPGDPFVWEVPTDPSFPEYIGPYYVNAIAFDHDVSPLNAEDTNWFELGEPHEPEPPVAVNDSAITDEGTPVVIDVLANDYDNDGTIDPTTVAIVSDPINGTVSVNSTTGTVTYTPDSEYIGSDSFTYTVNDSDGDTSNVATVDITVNSVTTDMGLIPSMDTVAIGETFTVTIYLDPTEAVGGWSTDVNFTQGLANATEVIPGSDWTASFDEGDIDNTTGTIIGIQTWTTGPYPDTNHTACTISFIALQAGVCTIELTDIEVLAANFVDVLDVTTHAVTVTIT